MKQIIFGVTAGMILVLFLGIIISVHGRTLRQDETEQSLEVAMQSVMKKLADGKEYPFADREEFVADFLEALLVQLNSDSDLTVHILKADEKKGLLSVEVVETYRHPNGETGKVSARRTMILDTVAETQRR